jgi:hypothetical protein
LLQFDLRQNRKFHSYPLNERHWRNKLKKSAIVLFLMAQSLYAMASDQSTCTANKGSYISGVVTSKPTFQKASETLQGVKLSHTVLNVKSDQDGKTYQVAMDNVYAVDYVKNSNSIPKSLAAIKLNDHLSLCGALYTSGSPGVHWVHDNCNVAPTTSSPNGWVEEISSSGVDGVNLERSTAYCYLWGE